MTANLRVTMIQADLAWQDPATNRRNLAAHVFSPKRGPFEA